MHQSSVAVSDEKNHFVSLSVQRISKEPGARIVHYFLDDSDGLPNLAVIGLEQRSRHMSYAVTERFIDLAGLDKAEFSVARWKSKRAVVTWLKGFIQNPQYPPCSGANPIILSSPGHDKEILLDVDSTEEENCNAENVKDIADTLVPAGDIVWLGGFTTCGKRLQHYRSFQRNGVTISVNSFIYILSISGGDNLIAYIEDLYEDNKLQKKMKVRWLHKLDEIKCDIPSPTPHAREVFMTPFREVYLLECCNGEVTVLSWEHFQQCMLRFPSDAAHAYVCRRSFGPDEKSFDICSVTGYWQQNILCMSGITNYCSLASESAAIHKGERAIVGKRGFKAPRSSRKRFGKLVSSHAGGFLAQDNTSYLSHDTANVGAGNKMDMLSSSEIDFARPGEEVELLSEDSGLRGCWHRCTVLQENLGKVNLRFEDIPDVDGSGLLEEWHPLGKVAGPDKLGLRYHERWTLRPPPSIVNIAPADEPGIAVDAWWDDGWWEGVLIGKEADGRVRVQLRSCQNTITLLKFLKFASRRTGLMDSGLQFTEQIFLAKI